MSDDRLRILACWPYSRRGWVAPIEGLAGRGHHVTYLGYRTPADEPSSPPIPAERDRVFWRDFRSGHDVVRRLRPDRIVLMGTEGAWQLATVAAGRRAGVPTAVLQHGLLSDPQSYRMQAPALRGIERPGPRTRLPAIRFVARTLRRHPRELFRALRYLASAAWTTPWEAAPRHPVPARMADAYLVASTRSAPVHLEHDHVGVDRVVPVGLAEFDELLLRPPSSTRSGTALLIDTPHTGGPHGLGTMAGAEKAARLEALAEDLRARGWTLTVKLHPDSYGDTWPVDGPGLRYARDEDVGELIDAAAVILGFDSSLTIPALHRRPGLLLTVPGRYRGFQDRAAAVGAVPEPVPFDAVRAEDVLAAAAGAAATAEGRSRFVEEFVGPPDGRSLDRVETALRTLRVRT